MKRILFTMLFGLSLLAGHAQNVESSSKDVVFNAGKMYISTKVSGLNFSYTGHDKLNLNLSANVGYFIDDDVMLGFNGQVAFYSRGEGLDSKLQEVGLGGYARYYMEQNGLYLGVSANWAYKLDVYNDFQPEVNLGYAFFLSRTVTIEPEIYYRQSFVNHSKYSGAGLRIGFGIYL